MDLFLDLNAIAEGFHRRLSDREIHIVTQRKNVDQHIVLGRRGQTFTVRDKVFQLFSPHSAAQGAPGVVAEGHDRTQMGIRECRLEGRQFIGERFAGTTQGINVAFYIRFNPNRRTAMLWQNATLNLRHHSS